MLRRLALHLGAALLMAAEYVFVPAPAGVICVAATAALWVGLLAYLVTFNRGQFFVSTLYEGARDKAQIAFTFDDGPDPGYTPRILDVLREQGVKATFFVVGRCADAHPELVLRIAREGHLVASHTYSHSNTFHLWPARRMAADIARGIETIERLVGLRPRYFRPPQGLRVPTLNQALSSLSAPPWCVTWTVRGLDTVSRSPSTIVARIERRLAPGAIIALHDGSTLGGFRDRSATIEALRILLGTCRARGLSCVRLDELLHPALEPGRLTAAQ
jgi:peptidoglycan/xylan/chitin deacetylase (PgdA/CDA1 family)